VPPRHGKSSTKPCGWRSERPPNAKVGSKLGALAEERVCIQAATTDVDRTVPPEKKEEEASKLERRGREEQPARMVKEEERLGRRRKLASIRSSRGRGSVSTLTDP